MNACVYVGALNQFTNNNLENNNQIPFASRHLQHGEHPEVCWSAAKGSTHAGEDCGLRLRLSRLVCLASVKYYPVDNFSFAVHVAPVCVLHSAVIRKYEDDICIPIKL